MGIIHLQGIVFLLQFRNLSAVVEVLDPMLCQDFEGSRISISRISESDHSQSVCVCCSQIADTSWLRDAFWPPLSSLGAMLTFGRTLAVGHYVPAYIDK